MNNASHDHSATAVAVPYELRLKQDREFAEKDSDLYFTRRNLVFKSLDRICALLTKLNIPYTIIGALALYEHGYCRLTNNVDLLISKKDADILYAILGQHGYVMPFIISRSVRDKDTGVNVDIYESGNLPGLAARLPLKFPEPIAVPSNGTTKNFADLSTLINLKLAAGHGDVCYNRHFVDVLELIKTTKLPLQIADSLHEFVRSKYRELWNQFRSACKYVQYFDPNAPDHKHIAEILQLEGLVQVPNKTGLWMTTDPELSIKYEMHDVAEWDADFHFPDNN